MIIMQFMAMTHSTKLLFVHFIKNRRALCESPVASFAFVALLIETITAHESDNTPKMSSRYTLLQFSTAGFSLTINAGNHGLFLRIDIFWFMVVNHT